VPHGIGETVGIRAEEIERAAGVVRGISGVHMIVGRRQADRVASPCRPDVGEVEYSQRLTGGQADALTQSADYC